MTAPTPDSVALMGVKGGPAIRPGSQMPTSLLLKMAGKTILIDAGLGAARGICDQGTALTDIDLICVTHLHSDHYLELGPFFHTAWTAGLNREIPVIGPDGLDAYWAGFLASMKDDIDLRRADEGRCDLASLPRITTIAPGVIHEADGLKITALRNIHPPLTDTYALKFETDDANADACFVFSGDTAFLPEMADFAQNADLLIHEAMLTEGVDALCAKMTNGDDRLRAHILRSHTSAQDVGRIAQDARVKQLALIHMVPDGDPDFTDADWIAAVREHYAGPLHIGKDGNVIALMVTEPPQP